MKKGEWPRRQTRLTTNELGQQLYENIFILRDCYQSGKKKKRKRALIGGYFFLNSKNYFLCFTFWLAQKKFCMCLHGLM